MLAGVEQYEAAVEPKELWTVPYGSHGRNYIVDPGKYEKNILAFFELSLGE